MLKFLIVEDHALVREGLVRVLHQLDSEVSVVEAASGDQALAALGRDEDVDLVLLDLALPGMDGFACLDLLRQRHPSIPVAILSAFDDPPTVNRVLANGASGFIPKAYSGEDLIKALRVVLAGHIFRPDGTAAPVLGDETPVLPSTGGVSPEECGLTERQGQVLGLMAKGKSNREIAQQLGLSEGTVKIHVTGVFKALGVSSRTQALVMAARYGIRL
ncbi:response regulator transcription factor [Azovibrio restrictus]|uniref:response regulator n=1 Tax=Azovibrio restrictus TaxID=146938 RepID=UPI0026F0D130|nr:response regulator transcription factor [Azovibrio restrictus]MDD3482759.1 response regulator transcription factor [Azovibrio restrictus]